MTRSGFRRLWILVLVVLMGASYLIYNKTSDKQLQINSQLQTKKLLILQRESIQSMAEKLRYIDELTLHEQDATRLDILKFLSLEEDRSFEFVPGTKIYLPVGSVQIYERGFDLKGTMPYKQMQKKLDELYENERIVLKDIEIEHVDEPGSLVRVKVAAKMFALDKGQAYKRNIIRRKR